MQKLCVADAASKLGISKEAVYNRIRRNTIQSVEEDGIRYVILEDEKDNTTFKPQPKQTALSSLKDNNKGEFVKYLINEIEYLKLKNKSLQEDKEKLFREKEDILISSKNEIKAMYQERDEKLQYFLTLLEKPLLARTDQIEAKAIDVSSVSSDENFVSLKEFLDSLYVKKKKRKIIKKTLVKNAYENPDIKIIGGMLFVNRNLDIDILSEDENEED
ncbi:hypothetical protein [Campylobacter geochelonis]|uniref:Phage integrase n=1 Tax=Campylobacter geochelonis TaxID=1780362 RepID=A0A128ECG7_9BACT|nr:hypothetical protein [Campylobacter geochelonis]QKF70504.1 hypothetical protein CGEO_0166 [Campylobacter geochelonis]CZE46151.1 phage integrase [Campylobacter geochelonis]CZE46483.1 phage integrase [Campylobacter geochelonis]CZE50454.1 phage integrase [Campylobacter geochelonis]